MNQFVPKLFDCMKTYSKEQCIKDIVSGIIVAIIALPLSIALALASGVGPEQGIYTAIFAGFVKSFLVIYTKTKRAFYAFLHILIFCSSEVDFFLNSY